MEHIPTSVQHSAVRRLAGQSAVYALGNLGLKIAGLLLLPLYLDEVRLSIADYGHLGLLETTAQLVVALAGAGIASGLLRYTAAREEASPEDYLGTALFTVLGIAGVAVAVFMLLAEPLAGLLIGDRGYATVLRWTGAYIGFKVLGAIPYMVLRVRERAGLFLAALLAEVTILLIGVYVALVHYDAGLSGIMMAFTISAALVAVPLSIASLRFARFTWQKKLAGDLLRFGMPLAMAALAGILLNAGDRFVLQAMLGPEPLAIYLLAAKFGGLINMLFVQSFNMSFSVLGLKSIDTTGVTDLHRRAFRHFVVIAGWGVLGVSLLAFDATRFISSTPEYLSAEPLILPIAYGFMLYGLYFLVVNVLYSTKKTRNVATLVIGAAVANIILNILLIPFLGVMGAALSSIAGYGLLLAISVRQARREMPLNLPWKAFWLVSGIIVVLWAVALPSSEWEPLARILFRMAIIGLYPALMLVTGLYSRSEVKSVYIGIRGARR